MSTSLFLWLVISRGRLFQLDSPIKLSIYQERNNICIKNYGGKEWDEKSCFGYGHDFGNSCVYFWTSWWFSCMWQKQWSHLSCQMSYIRMPNFFGRFSFVLEVCWWLWIEVSLLAAYGCSCAYSKSNLIMLVSVCSYSPTFFLYWLIMIDSSISSLWKYRVK